MTHLYMLCHAERSVAVVERNKLTLEENVTIYEQVRRAGLDAAKAVCDRMLVLGNLTVSHE